MGEYRWFFGIWDFNGIFRGILGNLNGNPRKLIGFQENLKISWNFFGNPQNPSKIQWNPNFRKISIFSIRLSIDIFFTQGGIK
jgi:hypothetical protein